VGRYLQAKSTTHYGRGGAQARSNPYRTKPGISKYDILSIFIEWSEPLFRLLTGRAGWVTWLQLEVMEPDIDEIGPFLMD